MRLRFVLSSVLTLGLLSLPATASADPGNARNRPERAVCGNPGAERARCHAHVVTRADGVTPLATTGPTGLSPAKLRTAYGLSALAGSAGGNQTVAIIDAYDNPNAEADMNAYRSTYGIPACTANGCFRKVNQNGGTTSPAGNVGWGQEIDLDIEMVSAMCSNCHILLVEASSNSFSDLSTAVNRAAVMGANEISNSYGGNEFFSETLYEGPYNHPGIAITVSSGDAGYGVEFPAASRYVTAVGGTTLNVNPDGTRASETVWSGAGSGCSAYVPKPAFQHDPGCARRTVADVAAVADPNTGVSVYDSYGSTGGANWYVFGGTSVAAPIIASVYALAGNASALSGAGSLYSAPAGSLYDVTSGSNGHCGNKRNTLTAYLCSARAGYDGPTGNGTPIGAAAF
jgi:subtilase family serine protease